MKYEIPDPMGKLFHDFLHSQVKTARLIDAAVLEMQRYPQSLNLMKSVDALLRFEGEAVDEDSARRAEQVAPLIKEETENGFPFFYGLATVAIWGALEAFIRDLLVLCLENDTTFLSLEPIAKIRISLSQFELMPIEQRRFYILDTIERDIQSKFKQGASRFESLLRTFGLGGEIEDGPNRTLLELANVRNVLVHRSGIADQRLVTTCPWLGIQIGERVRVDSQMFSRYSVVTPTYAAIVFRRVVLHFKGDSEGVDKFIQTLSGPNA
jgi:hypothetical protein